MALIQNLLAQALPATQPATEIRLTADQVLEPYVYVFYAAFIIAFIFTPVMRSIAIYYNIIDKPDLVRKLHAAPVAYLGGVAVFLGWLAGMAMTQLIIRHGPITAGLDERLRIPMGIIVAALIIIGLGLWDDVKHISPRVKILGQILAAVALLASGVGDGVTKPFLDNIFTRLDVKLHLATHPEVQEAMVQVTSWLLTVALVVFCCNASNLMDGLDGLCGGVTGIMAIGFLIVSIVIAKAFDGVPEHFNLQGVGVVTALALLGGVLGFIPYNFNPASIFMGDTGSMFLGLMSATLIVIMGEEHGKWLLAGLVMFALPVLDTSLAFARRYVAGRPFFSADRHHFHHQLVQRGLTVRKAVLASYGLTIFFVLCGVMVCFLRTRYVLGFYMVLFGSIIVAAYKMGMVHERAKVVDKPASMGEETRKTSSIASSEFSADEVLEIRVDKPVSGQ